jgi:hypothetical protein
MEYKALPQLHKSIEDRTVVGLVAIHGNIDSGGDRSWPGSFADIKDNGRMRARFVWQHRTDEPPTAAINYIREIPRAELPEAVLKFAPEATGAVEVSRTYLDTPRGNEILAGIRAGAIEEMSYAYEIPSGGADTEEVDGITIRNIRKVRVFDLSDVLWGMNGATLGSKGQPLEIEHQAVLAAVDAHIKRYQALASLRAKEGRVLSDANRKRIETTREALAGADALLAELLAMTEPQKSEAQKADPAIIRREVAKFLRLQAQFNGVL